METEEKCAAEADREVGKKENEEEKEKEEEEERKRQKVVEEEKQQEALNKEFLDACRYKTVVQVKSLLERGADLFHCDEEESNGLHLACWNKDYEAAEEIAQYLIKKHKGLLRMFDNDQWSALHYAARFSSAKICEILIDNGCGVNGRTKLLSTPLTLCCSKRIDEETLKIAKLLIERGADLEAKSKNGNTALLSACRNGRDDLVQLLIDSKADVNAQNGKGHTPLIFAARNRSFGEKIIPILIVAGADVTMKENNGSSAVSHAYWEGGGKIMKALAPFVPEGCKDDLQNKVPIRDCPDPIGAMTEGLQFGCSPNIVWFSGFSKKGFSPAYLWALLRNGEFDISTIFQTLSDSANLDLWCYSTTELWQRSIGCNLATGETILHLAVKCKKLSPEDKIKIVQHIMSFYINPFVLDNNNKRAINYCTKEEKDLHHILANYQQWKPEKKVMDWYGPYCRQRLRTFLLVEKRLQLGIPRGVRNLIALYVAEREYVWVPKKK
jgi:ankyrin repeat protein